MTAYTSRPAERLRKHRFLGVPANSQNSSPASIHGGSPFLRPVTIGRCSRICRPLRKAFAAWIVGVRNDVVGDASFVAIIIPGNPPLARSDSRRSRNITILLLTLSDNVCANVASARDIKGTNVGNVTALTLESTISTTQASQCLILPFKRFLTVRHITLVNWA